MNLSVGITHQVDAMEFYRNRRRIVWVTFGRSVWFIPLTRYKPVPPRAG